MALGPNSSNILRLEKETMVACMHYIRMKVSVTLKIFIGLGMMGFEKNSVTYYEKCKKVILGTSDAWSMCRLPIGLVIEITNLSYSD